MKHYNITVIGRVQGVGFRASASNKARQLGVTGFVRNKPNGSVYIEAEGQRAVINDFIDWCKQGPSMARVEYIDVDEGPGKSFHSFEINH